MSDQFDDNGLLPLGDSDSSDDEFCTDCALLERRRKRRRDGLEATSHTRGEKKPILWFIDEDGLKKPLTPEKTTWFQMFVAGQKHMDETDHKKFRNKFRLPHAQFKELDSKSRSFRDPFPPLELTPSPVEAHFVADSGVSPLSGTWLDF